MKDLGTLYFFSGKMGAVKSTKTKQLKKKKCVLLSEDEWLENLYPNQIKTFQDFQNFSEQITPLIKNHIQNILTVGSNVIIDFPGNTLNQRKWF